ncbi:ribosomal protein L7/L12 [Streptomyces sp. 900105755]
MVKGVRVERALLRLRAPEAGENIKALAEYLGHAEKALAAVFGNAIPGAWDGSGIYAPDQNGRGPTMAVEYFTLVCDDVPNDVLLVDPGSSPLDVAQVVRRLAGLSLWRSKVLVDQAPVVILYGIPEEAAEIAVAALRDVGAQAEMRQQT